MYVENVLGISNEHLLHNARAKCMRSVAQNVVHGFD